MATHPIQEAMALAVGGDWEETRALLIGALILAGVREADSIVDVGCGSGRLAGAIANHFNGEYLGTDVVPELLDFARSQVENNNFRFLPSDGVSVPAKSESANIVCFFSVFTHLPHEAIYTYLREARRILRPGGKIVASFLEFEDPALWPVFDSMVENITTLNHHNQFTHRDDLTLFCSHLDLEVSAFIGATEPLVPLALTNGFEPTGEMRHFGQALMILQRPMTDS
jgi:SAM-dependent methyltransferase